MLVVDTERQPPQVLDKAAACILTDRCLGRRATSQRCTSCGGWFVQDQLEFTFRCALVTAVDAGQDHQPAVTCELQTRYPTFTCPACKYSSRTKIEPRSTAAELAKAEEAAGEAASFSSATKDEEQNHCSDQLSPDHVAAVYSLCSSNGQDNLASLNKSFIAICPDCGQRSSQLHEPCQVLDYVRNHVNSNPGSNDAAPASSCQTLLGCFGKGIYHTPASYGSISMSASPVEDVICHWVARLLVTIALHIARSTCTASNTQFASSTTTASASAASASSSSKSFHAYLPWRNWALETLREDVTVIDAANWVRPSLAGLLLPDRHSLLDLILAPPFIAAGGQQAGMTAHKLAVLMKRKLKELQQQQQLSLATVEGIRGVLEDMLSNDSVFKHYAADQRVGEFLAIAGISNIGELAPLMTLPYVQDQHVEVCPCCGTSVSTVSTVPLVGCSYCIMCLRCPSCQAEHEMTTTGNLAAAGLLTNSAALAEAAAAAAAADFLCPWCEDHDDTAAFHWYQGCLTDGEFDELKLTTATADQKEYFTQQMKVVNPWRIEQCLPNGFIVVLTVGYYSKVKRNWRYYIAPDGRSIRSKPEVEAWLEQQHWQQQQQQQQQCDDSVDQAAAAAAAVISDQCNTEAAPIRLKGLKRQAAPATAGAAAAVTASTMPGAIACHDDIAMQLAKRQRTAAPGADAQHRHHKQHPDDGQQQNQCNLTTAAAATTHAPAELLCSSLNATAAAQQTRKAEDAVTSIKASSSAAAAAAASTMQQQQQQPQGKEHRSRNPVPAPLVPSSSVGGTRLQRANELVSSIDAVLQLQLMSDSSPLKGSLALHAVWRVRRESKKSMQQHLDASMTRLAALHELVNILKDALGDLSAVNDAQQLLDQAWLQQAPQLGLAGTAAAGAAAAAEGSSSTAKGSCTTVLDLLLLCWSKEAESKASTAAAAAAATAKMSTCQVTTQVFLKACQLTTAAAAAPMSTNTGDQHDGGITNQHKTAVSQLCSQLAEGLALLLLI